jgi:putative transposase
MKSFQYRIYPTKSQKSLFKLWFAVSKQVWNTLLEWVKFNWETNHANLSNKVKLINKMVELKHTDQFKHWNQVHSQVLQNICTKLAKAFQNYFRRLKLKENPGYPRFKGKHRRVNSVCFPQIKSEFKITDSKLFLPPKFFKHEGIKTVFHRNIEGVIKTLTIKSTPTGKWYVTFICDKCEPESLPNSFLEVGMDLGIKMYATLSDGTEIINPKFVRSEERNLTKYQRHLSTLQEIAQESNQQSNEFWNEYSKKKQVLARIHERIKFKRDDFTHKLSRSWVDKYGVIVLEDLSIDKMSKNHKLARSILECSWRSLINKCEYKAENAGSNRKVIQVNPRNTSKICSKCGKIKENLTLKDREYECPHCNFKINRDLNAAINIRNLGINPQVTRLGIQPLAPPETEPRSPVL